MVQFIPARNGWSEAFQQIGQGVSEGYTQRSDEKALQKSIEDLGSNPTPRQILDALTKTRTHNPAAKQNILKNYLGVSEFEQLEKKYATEKQIADARLLKEQNEKILKKEKDDLKNLKEKNSALELVNTSELPDEKKQEYVDRINNNELDLSAIRQLTKSKKEDKKKVKEAEKIESVKGGLSTIQTMRGLRKKGNLGLGSGITKYFSNEALKDSGQYEQLGKSLIQQSTNIPIRNRQEFETLAHKLYDPTIPDAEAEGILDALEKILSDNLKGDVKEITDGQSTEGKIRVRNKQTGQTGTVTPFEGMDAKYDRI